MDGLRTVTVLEHEVVPVINGSDGVNGIADAEPHLSEAEAQALLRLNDLRPGFCQRLSGGIKLAQHCGIVRLPTCVVEVLPKIGMADARTPDELGRSRGALLAMLHAAQQVAITKIGPVPQQAVHAPLLDIFIETFLHCALDQARRGLLSRYVSHLDDLPVIKGRFQAHGHVRRNLVRPHLLHCEYDEFTADNSYNRAIRAALEACRTWVSRAVTQRLWFEAHARYCGITSLKMTAANVARLPRDRTTHRYTPVLTWCEWLLSLASPALNAGASQAPGLLFDMNRLFEAYVSGLEEAEAGDDLIVCRQGPVKALAKCGDLDAFALKPDLTVWRAGPDGSAINIVKVLDAKWKRLDPRAAQWGVDRLDVYQLLAYALRYSCTQLELIYPTTTTNLNDPSQWPIFMISSGSIGSPALAVKVRAVQLWGQPQGHTPTCVRPLCFLASAKNVAPSVSC